MLVLAAWEVMMTNGLPRGMASFYHVGVVGGRDDNDGKRAAEGDGIILSSGLWVVRALFGWYRHF